MHQTTPVHSGLIDAPAQQLFHRDLPVSNIALSAEHSGLGVTRRGHKSPIEFLPWEQVKELGQALLGLHDEYFRAAHSAQIRFDDDEDS